MSTVRPELYQGHTLDVVRTNTQLLVASGKSEPQAKAIAYRMARESLKSKMETEGVEVFAACQVPGKIPVDEQGLEEIERNYNEAQAGKGHRYEAPNKLTHGRGLPALGWVKALKRQGKKLLAVMRNPSDTLLDAIINEEHPNPSVELRRNLTIDGRQLGLSLQAIAWLGGDPPAVKDLAYYSEDDDSDEHVYYNFEEWHEMPDNDNTKDQGGTGGTHIHIHAGAGDKAGESEGGGGGKRGGGGNPANPGTGGDLQTPEQVEKERKRQEKELEEAEKRGYEKAKAEFEQDQQKKAETARRDQNKLIVDSAIKDGKIAPKDREYFTELLDSQDPSLHFGEDKSSTVYEETVKRIKEGKASFLFSEDGDGVDGSGVPASQQFEDDPDGENRHKRIVQYAKTKGYVLPRDYEKAFEETKGGTII